MWAHVEDLAMWTTAFRGIVADFAAASASQKGEPLPEPKSKSDEELEVVLGLVRPGSSADFAGLRTGPGKDDVELAFYVGIKDETRFRAAFAEQFEVKRTTDGFYAKKKKKKETSVAPVDSDKDDKDEDASPTAGDAKKKKKDPLAEDVVCTTKSDHAVCGFGGKVNAPLFAWLESRPALEGARADNVVIDFYAPPMRDDIIASAKDIKSETAKAFATSFDRMRIVASLGSKGFAFSLSSSFAPEPKIAAVFASDPRRALPSRVFAQWPSSSTVAFGMAPLGVVSAAVKKEAAGVDKAAAVVRALERTSAWGAVVERDELARLIKECEAAGDDGKKLFALKPQLRRAIDGYTVTGMAEAGADGTTATVKQLVDEEMREHPGSQARAPLGKGLPAGAVFIEKPAADAIDLTSALEAAPAKTGAKPAAKAKKPTTKPGEAKGKLVMSDLKGALWVLDGNEEAYLVSAAKRLLAAPPGAGLPALDAQTVVMGVWASSFGSYWSSEMELGGGLSLDLASLVTPGAKPKPATALTADQVTQLKKTIGDIKKNLAAPVQRIPLFVTVDDRTRTIAVSAEAPLATWKVAAVNAAVPLGLMALPLLIAFGSLKD